MFAFFDLLESDFEQHPWLVGDEYSYADIAWFVQYFLMSRTGVIDFENYVCPIPRIRPWCGLGMVLSARCLGRCG